jgi:hypothetical protein
MARKIDPASKPASSTILPFPKLYSSPKRGPWAGTQEELNRLARDLADWCRRHSFVPESIVKLFFQHMELCAGVEPIAIPDGVQLQRSSDSFSTYPLSVGDWYAGQEQNNLRALELMSRGSLIQDIVQMQWMDTASEFLIVSVNPWFGFTPKTMPIDYLVTFLFNMPLLDQHPEAAAALSKRWEQVGFLLQPDAKRHSVRVEARQWNRYHPDYNSPWQPKDLPKASRDKKSRARSLTYLIPQAITFVETHGGSASEEVYLSFIKSIRPKNRKVPFVEGEDYPKFDAFRKWWSDAKRSMEA